MFVMVEQVERQAWMGTLAKASASDLESLVAKLGDVPSYRFLRSPETGLTMVRGRAGGVGQVFNLGEMTLTRCVVQVDVVQVDVETAGEEGPLIMGFGYVWGRSHRHAELAALCDGLLQHGDWRSRVMEAVIEPLKKLADEKRAREQERTAATKVNFFTMLRGE